jgi:hypothetical protein
MFSRLCLNHSLRTKARGSVGCAPSPAGVVSVGSDRVNRALSWRSQQHVGFSCLQQQAGAAGSRVSRRFSVVARSAPELVTLSRVLPPPPPHAVRFLAAQTDRPATSSVDSAEPPPFPVVQNPESPFASEVQRFRELYAPGNFYSDKTRFIRHIEAIPNGRQVIALFPRRFGKSLFLDTLAEYYDVRNKNSFAQLFGHLDIGRQPLRFDRGS